jgi:hypothetical protein
MVYIHRVIGGQAGGDGCSAPVRVKLNTRSGRTVEFVAHLSLSLYFPSSVRYEFVEQAVADFCSRHVPEAEPADASGVAAGEIVGYSDEITGDVATEAGASLDTSPDDYSECSPLKLQVPKTTDFSDLHDVTLCRAESGVAKMRWLGDYVAKRVDPGGRVLVGGDSPGTLSRRLLYRGVSVEGVDVRNENNRSYGPPGSGRPVYVQKRGRVSVATLCDDHGVDWGGCVFDTAVDKYSAESDTAVNCGSAKAMALAGVPVCIAKARSVPRAPGDWYLLDNPGWEVRGCESYLEWAGGTDGDWPEGARCRVRVPEDSDSVFVRVDTAAHVARPGWWDFFFKRRVFDGLEWHEVLREHWYHFVTMRSVEHAKRRASFGLGKELMASESAVDAWLALKSWMGPVDPNVRQEVAGRMRVDDPVGARGVPRSVLERTPGLLGKMAGRYAALLALGQDPGAECPINLGLIMKHPGAGCLLADLSQIRGLMGEEQVCLADFSRVLPWGSMSILASDLFFRLFYWLSSMTSRVFKPWHAWELQHKLWCVSSFGTDEERFTYFFDQFERVFSGVDQLRGAARRTGTMERAYRKFEENLQSLGIRDAYIRFDRPYSLFVASRAQPHRRRAVHSVRAGTVSETVLSDDRSMSSSMPVRGGRPITDLADFGMSMGWGPRTTLHTVLSATRGRVNEERAYLYWCSLSPIQRPRTVPRTQWVPRQRLISRDVLEYRVDGLQTPEAFVLLRDEHLAQLAEQLQ